MNNTIYFDSNTDEATRRAQLYDGQIFMFSPSKNSSDLCAFARGMIQSAFGDLDPLKAQYSMPVEKYAEILAELKPRFIHHPKSKQYIQAILEDFRCDLRQTYFDVPRLRSATSDNYLTSGIAYAFHPHRDTWYSAPFCQLNWWIPVFDIQSENSLALHPKYWTHPLRNGSNRYNYYQWNKESRKNAATYVHEDTRDQPRPEEPVELDPQFRIVTKPGGILLFSGSYLHSTVPNTAGMARFSIDFRTVHLDDVIGKIGAPNIDSACTGTTLRDFLCGADLSQIPEELVRPYENPPPRVDLGFGGLQRA